MTPKPDTATPPADTAAPVPDRARTPKIPGSKATGEIGGRKGPEPTRYGDWEKDGRCVDF